MKMRMMRVFLFTAAIFLTGGCEEDLKDNQAETSYHTFVSYNDFKSTLAEIASIQDVTVRSEKLNVFWDSLESNNQIPFVFEDSVAFLYKGNASSVKWAGDFTGWSPSFVGARIGETDVWLGEKAFPVDARLDYKIVVDGAWILDPSNPWIQHSGFGPNSELRMPDWKFAEETLPNPTAPKGSLSDNQLILSKATNLNYTVQYKVYTPHNYSSLQTLPSIYITDGHEYANDNLGAMVIVLDNLIHQEKIKPVIAIFIDPRDPSNLSNNKRMQEYRANQKFADFISDELVPTIDANYKTQKDATQRAILGTSLGGWNAAFVGLKRSDVFNLIGIHSPAFDDAVIQNYSTTAKLPLKVFMSTGVIYDTQNQARAMKSVLEQKTYPLQYIEVNEGHSWGNWRALLEEPLTYFFPKE